MMFRMLTIVSVVIVAIGAVLWRARMRRTSTPVLCPPSRWPLLENLAVWVAVLSALVLAVTGFCTATLMGRALSGFYTLIHVSFGAAYAVSMAGLAVMRAEAYRFRAAGSPERFSDVQKVCFWILVVGALLLALSILSAMLPLLGTDGQRIATEVHRYSALVSVLAGMVYAAGRR